MKKNCIEIDIKTFGLSDLANIQIQTFDKADREQAPIKVIGDPYQQGKSEVIVFAQPVPKDPKDRKAIGIFECAYFALGDGYDQIQ